METVEAVDEPVIDEPVVEEPLPEVVEPKAAAASASAFVQTTPIDIDRKPVSLEAEHDAYVSEGEFYVTVIEEKNVGTRNGLLLGTLSLMMFSLMTGMVYNLFSKDLEVGSINDDIFSAVIVDDIPMDEEDIQFNKDKDGGGGGGGGNEDPNPVSKGERAPMRTDPQFAPSVTMDRLTNPTIPIQMALKGPVNEQFKVDARYGYKLGGDQLSDGPGSGGGQGTGRDRGQGPGDGRGYGPGSNGGLGGGNNGGLGPGGDGPGGIGEPPPRRVGVTQALKIISKPRPGYTDPARQNNIQGTVILRVTFLASGQIGSISAVKGLPNGLTEQAIAAARRISFEPAKRDGVGQSITRQVEYTFSIY
jgi:TonB family protein